LPISEIQFPSIVICSQGFDINAIIAALYDEITYAADTNTTELFGLNSIQSAKLAVRAIRGEVRVHALAWKLLVAWCVLMLGYIDYFEDLEK